MFLQESNWFSKVGKTIGTELLSEKNSIDSQTWQSKSSSQPVNLSSGRPFATLDMWFNFTLQLVKLGSVLYCQWCIVNYITMIYMKQRKHNIHVLKLFYLLNPCRWIQRH